MSRFAVRAATAAGAVLLLAACSSGGGDITPTVTPSDDTTSPSATAAPSPSVSPTATPTKMPTEYASPDELPFEGNVDGDVAIIKGEVFVWNAATSSWNSRGKVDDNKKPDSEDVVIGEPLEVPSKVKTFTTKLKVQTVIAPNFEKAPEFANAPWTVSVSPTNAATLTNASPDPITSVLVLPNFVPTGKESKFTLTIKTSKETYTYTVTVK